MIAYNSNGIEVRPARQEDIAPICMYMRLDDLAECVAQHGDSQEALLKSYMAGEAYTIIVHGKPVGMFGICVNSFLDNSANIWLLGAKGLDKIKKTFMRLSKEFVNEWLKTYYVLWAQVVGRYTKTHRWLEWLGAERMPTYKLNGVDFNNFVIRRA